MRTLKVIKTFKDKKTKEVLKVGAVVERSNKRGDEIVAAGYAEDITKEEDDK